MTTESAQAAAAIRKELKKAFPSIKFSVTSSRFSGGDSVRISWENGPTTKMVEKISNQYQYGHFDGMDDSYNYSNCRKDIPQAKYVHAERKVTEDMYECGMPHIRRFRGWENVKTLREVLPGTGYYTNARQEIDRVLDRMDLTHGWNDTTYSNILFNRGEAA